MSASELLEQVRKELKKLPAEQQERFFDEILTLEGNPARDNVQPAAGSLPWPDIHARHRRIFGDTVLQENIVLAAREEEN